MITVSPTLTAVTVREPDQMVTVSVVVTTFPMLTTQLVPFTVTYTTTDGTATGTYVVYIACGCC